MHLNTFNYQIPIEIKLFIILNRLNNKIIVLKNTHNNALYFVKIPVSVFFSVQNSNSFLFSSFNLKILNDFLKILSKQVSILRFPFFVKLFLKGLGYRIKLNAINNARFLELKLGFSHTITLKIESQNIAVTVKKNSLILSGFSKTEIGNLANRIYNLRSPNIYTGKGFRYKRVVLHLKDVKKT